MKWNVFFLFFDVTLYTSVRQSATDEEYVADHNSDDMSEAFESGKLNCTSIVYTLYYNHDENWFYVSWQKILKMMRTTIMIFLLRVMMQ